MNSHNDKKQEKSSPDVRNTSSGTLYISIEDILANDNARRQIKRIVDSEKTSNGKSDSTEHHPQ